MSEQRWDFAAIQNAASQINGSVSSIHSLLDEGKGSLKRLSEVWGGEGSESYKAVQSRWDATSLELNNSLQNLAGLVNTAVQSMQDTERGVQSRFA